MTNKDSWQCQNCKTIYAPHVDKCECMKIDGKVIPLLGGHPLGCGCYNCTMHRVFNRYQPSDPYYPRKGLQEIIFGCKVF